MHTRSTPFLDGDSVQVGSPLEDSSEVHKPTKSPEESIRTNSRPYNDLWAAFAWLASVIVVIVFGIMGYHKSTPETIEMDPAIGAPSAQRMFAIIATAAASSLFASIGLVSLMQNFARQVIYASNGMLLGLYAAGIVMSSIAGEPLGAVVFAVIFGIHALFLYIFRRRIPFAALCLQTSARIMRRQSGTVVTALSFAIAQIVFFLFWSSGLVGHHDISSDECEINHAIFWPWLFFLFWGLQVLNGIVHATTCGVVAMWYFTGGALPRNPTLGALRRACSYSLGSICLGSLIVAILKTLCTFLRFLTTQGGRDNGFLRAVARCLLNAIESLMEYFNAYAFVHIAIYGTPYVESARATWRMVKTSAIHAIVNDDFSNNATFFLVLWSTLFSGTFCSGLYRIPGHEHGWAIPFGLGAGVGLLVSRTVFSVLSSGVMAIFVCYVEQPGVLSRVHPEFASAMERAVGEYSSRG